MGYFMKFIIDVSSNDKNPDHIYNEIHKFIKKKWNGVKLKSLGVHLKDKKDGILHEI